MFSSKMMPEIRQPERRCLSCGTTKNMGRKTYCSPYCRQRLTHILDLRVGLLQALGARFATFYFSETMITLDLLLYGADNILRFPYPRTIGLKPANDFSLMADLLGAAWWDEQKRTKKRFKASEHVLGLGTICDEPLATIKPTLVSIPAIRTEFLSAMHITKQELQGTNIAEVVRNTYRLEVKKRHPDAGGKPEDFRNLHEAYKEIRNWLAAPRYTMKVGFPDKWFYNGNSSRWLPPQPRLNFW